MRPSPGEPAMPPEIPGRQPPEAENGKHLGAHGRRANVGRQDRAAEPPPSPALFPPPIVDSRRPHLHRPRPRRHLPTSRKAVADHQGVSLGISSSSVPLDVLLDPRLQSRQQNSPRPLPRQLVQARLGNRFLRIVVLYYSQHGWRPLPPSPARPAVGLIAQTQTEGYAASSFLTPSSTTFGYISRSW